MRGATWIGSAMYLVRQSALALAWRIHAKNTFSHAAHAFDEAWRSLPAGGESRRKDHLPPVQSGN